MKKKTVKLVSAVVVLGVLCAAYEGVNFYVTSQEEKETEENDTSVDLVSLEADDITAVSFTADQNEVEFDKKDDSWTEKSDANFPVNQDTVDSAVKGVASLTADQEISDVEDMSQYDLDNPQNTITLTTADGDTSLQIGMESSNNQYYVKKEDDDKNVYLVSSSSIEPFMGTLYDFAESGTFPSVTSATITDVKVDKENSYELTQDADNLFWNAMLNSVYFMIGGFVILMPLSFGLAMLVTAKIKGTGFFRTCYFLPNMLGTTAVALMWTFMLNPNFGIFNTIENIFGLHGTIPDVLTIKTVNVWIVVLVNEWMYAGYNMLIFAAGLVAIPDELNEAAALDGATGWQRIRYIILPLMKNSFKVFSILCITGCLKVFDIIWAMTRGGPNDISSTPSIMLYTQGFSYKLFGRSSAYGVILLVLGVVLSLITNHLFREDKDLAM